MAVRRMSILFEDANQQSRAVRLMNMSGFNNSYEIDKEHGNILHTTSEVVSFLSFLKINFVVC